MRGWAGRRWWERGDRGLKCGSYGVAKAHDWEWSEWARHHDGSCEVRFRHCLNCNKMDMSDVTGMEKREIDPKSS